MEVALGVTLAALGSLSVAAGSVFQHRSIRVGYLSGAARILNVRQIAGLFRDGQWISGATLILIGVGLHVTALSIAPLATVQPVGLLAVPACVLLAARITRSTPAQPVWLSVAVTLAGVSAFTLLTTRLPAGSNNVVDGPLITVVLLIACLVAGLVAAVGAACGGAVRSLALATSGAVFFGLTSALVKTLFLIWEQGDSLVSSAVLYVAAGILATGLVGGLLVQQAHATGHAEVVVGSLATVDPMIAVTFGLIALGEAQGGSGPLFMLMIAAGCLAVSGVVWLSRHYAAVNRVALHRETLGTGHEEPVPATGQEK